MRRSSTSCSSAPRHLHETAMPRSLWLRKSTAPRSPRKVGARRGAPTGLWQHRSVPDAAFQPVIVIGAARSGTKLLRDSLATHADVARVPYDVNYVWRFGN